MDVDDLSAMMSGGATASGSGERQLDCKSVHLELDREIHNN